MKAVILAGGLGTRISEETHLKPKPMVEIGGMPILWHIMKIYGFHGISDFIICCGYKGDVIKEYFANYFLYMSDVTVNLRDNSMSVLNKYSEDWKVTLVNTGTETQTGGRLLRVQEYLQGDRSFCFTYGDGVGDLDIQSTIKFHNTHGKKATMSVACPPSRFGAVSEKDGLVTSFKEKPISDGEVINAGFFVCLVQTCLLILL